MKFNNEESFRQWIVAELPKHLDKNWVILHGKNVSDIVLCRNDQNHPLMLFVEIKYHKSGHGRIGFGSGSGTGYQVEILRKKPLYLEKFLKWIIADQDSERCLFFTNENVRNNCAGKSIEEGKQSNFVFGLFDKNKEHCFSLLDTPGQIATWAIGQ